MQEKEVINILQNQFNYSAKDITDLKIFVSQFVSKTRENEIKKLGAEVERIKGN